MKNIKKNISFIYLFIGTFLIFWFLFSLMMPKANNISQTKVEEPKEKRIEMIRLSAIGDSLTEGIGDTTSSGGYVPLLQKDLSAEYPVDVFQAENFGKSGDRSDQILKRLKKNEDMSKSVKDADVILLTVGGNDLMQALQPKLFGKISIEKMEKPKKVYLDRMQELYDEIRRLNPEAPIYQLGIYNPYYLTFSEIPELQDIVNFWNKSSQEFVNEQDNAYFVPINDDMYQGLKDGTVSLESAETTSDSGVVNGLISPEDTVHPNNQGYQIIANAFELKMGATKKEWLK